MGYLSNFIVYVLAMLGVIMLALFVFKNATSCKTTNSNCNNLRVLDTLSLGARKTLYIVAAGKEQFLIAGDVDHTSLISKLNSKESYEEEISAIATSENKDYTTKSYRSLNIPNIPKRTNFMDRTNNKIHTLQASPYDAVMKNLAEKIKG